MPWYVHERGTEFSTGVECGTRKRATEYRTGTQIVTFEPTCFEKNGWRIREEDRFSSGAYSHVPWFRESWITETIADHYAHLSVENPGLIAYTPSDEFGCDDRQLRVRPGKYLAEFASHLTKPEIDVLCAQCRQYDKTIELHFAKTPDEIVTVYRNGPDSCMAGGKAQNPVRVYGDSDLQIAYIGSIDNAKARCIVWPEKKLYGRAYGNEHVIKFQLEKLGYEYRSQFTGAKVRAIEHSSGGWVMPYMDCAGYADLRYEDDKPYFLLGCGDYDMQTTDGYVCEADPEPEYGECENCRDECSADTAYCYTCRTNRYICIECDGERFDRLESTRLYTGVSRICPDCFERLTVHCAIPDCDESWVEIVEFSTTETHERIARDVIAICRNCAQNYQTCQSCTPLVYFPIADLACPDCPVTVRCSETASLPLESANDDIAF